MRALQGLPCCIQGIYFEVWKLTDLVFRLQQSKPISPITAVASRLQARQDQHSRPQANCEVSSPQTPNLEEGGGGHRPTTQPVATGTAAPTHSGIRGRRLLRSETGGSSDCTIKQHLPGIPTSATYPEREEPSSLPLAGFDSGLGKEDLSIREAGTSSVAGRKFYIRTPSSSSSQEAGPSLQEQGSSQTEYLDLQNSGGSSHCSVKRELLGTSRRAVNRRRRTSSSSPLAAFDFGFGKEEAERISRPDQLGSGTPPGTPPNTPAPTHPNLVNFNFSFPIVESCPLETAEEKESVEPSLPALPIKRTGRAPRGLSSAIAQACRKFESDPQSAHPIGTSAQSTATAVKAVAGPRLELPSFPRLSIGAIKADIQEQALSEVARGKRPELESTTPSRRQPSEDMDLLNPDSAVGMTAHRREAVRMAKSQEAAVIEKCKRSGAAAPPYTFDELIGKGSFGRVYKG